MPQNNYCLTSPFEHCCRFFGRRTTLSLSYTLLKFTSSPSSAVTEFDIPEQYKIHHRDRRRRCQDNGVTLPSDFHSHCDLIFPTSFCTDFVARVFVSVLKVLESCEPGRGGCKNKKAPVQSRAVSLSISVCGENRSVRTVEVGHER